jgi:hypothetical protein
MMRARRVRGMALADVTVAVLIGSAVLGGFVGTLSARLNVEREAAADRFIAEARVALAAYAQVHGRLPCPADPRVATGTHNAGVASPASAGVCAGGNFGVVPWTTLGLSELDPWGNRLSYRVARDLVNDEIECEAEPVRGGAACLRVPLRSSWSHPTQDGMAVREMRWSTGGLERTEPIASGLAVIIVSHGANGHFAFGANGRQRSAPSGSAFDQERNNANTGSVSFFASPADHSGPQCTNSGTECGFDDRVAWISRGEVLTAIARAGHQL